MSGSNPDQLWNLIPNGPTPLTGQEQLLAAQTASPNAPMYRYPANAFTDAAVVVASSVIATGTTISRTLQNRFADRYSVLDSLTPGQPDGTTDNSAQLNAALTAAAGVAQLLFPKTTHPYRINSSLIVQGNSHLIIEAGATIKVSDGAVGASVIALADMASNVVIELYGTLDGNCPLTTGTAGGIVSLNTFPNTGSNNIYITGKGLGVITNCINWGINLTICNDSEVNGVTVSKCGNSTEFAGLTKTVPVTGGSYTNNTGALVLLTSAAHNIVPGQTFIYEGSTTNAPFATLLGEYVAEAGTSGTTINTHTALGLGTITINQGGSTSKAGPTKKCNNVRFVNCTIQDILDLGIVLYGGCINSYITGCVVSGCTGPTIYNDDAQPGSNLNCAVFNNYSHDSNQGAGVVSNAQNVPNRNNSVYNNFYYNSFIVPMQVGGSYNTQVFGNFVQNCTPSAPINGFPGLLNVSSAIDCFIWNNTFRDPQPAIISHTGYGFHAAGSSYDPATGNVVLATNSSTVIPVSGTFRVFVVRGIGSQLDSLKGLQTATAGTAGAVVTFTAAPGLDITSLFDGQIVYYVPYPAASSIASGTYTSATGAVSLTTTGAHGLVAGNYFVVDLIAGTGTGIISLNGLQLATASTAGTTLNFTAPAGLGSIAISGGSVLPPNIGIGVYPSFTGNGTINQINTVITGNYFDDDGDQPNMTAAIAGTWGNFGYSGGNYYGRRAGNMPDISVYSPTTNGSNQGPSYDSKTGRMLADYRVVGRVTFSGNQGTVGAPSLQPQGLTPWWNFSSGPGEVDFFCGQGAGAPGGFNFLQVTPLLTTTGTYDSGTGNTTLTTGAPHGMLVGSGFSVSNLRDSGQVNSLNGTQTATGGTTGTTLNFTDSSGLSVSNPLTSGQITNIGSGLVSFITTGSYDTGTGNVTLTTNISHGLAPSGTFVVAGIEDSGDINQLDASWTAVATTSGSTLTFQVAAGKTITNPILAGATIIPNGTAGGVVNTGVGAAGSIFANDGYGNTRLGAALVQNFKTAALANAGTVTIPANTGFMVVQNASSLALGTIVMPSPSAGSFPLTGGNELEVNFQNPIGTLTLTGTITNGPTAIAAAGTSISFIANSGTSWLRRIMT